MRQPVPAVLVALAVAAFGAVVLGEYDLSGTTPLVAGALFGIAIAEVAVTVARSSDGYLQAAVALVAEAGLVWATWISSGHHLDLAASTAWVGVAVGTALAPLWLRSVGRRGARSRDGEGPLPGG
jgi:O-antigen/teichoic acid export membrane protein